MRRYDVDLGVVSQETGGLILINPLFPAKIGRSKKMS